VSEELIYFYLVELGDIFSFLGFLFGANEGDLCIYVN